MRLQPPNLVSFTETSAELDDEKEKMKAHTQECKIWGPFEYGKAKYHIIDTPGLADTAGLEKDAKNLDGILEFVCNCDTIIGIILVVNGAASRFTSNLQLVFSKLSSNLPDEVLENACVVFTNCQLASDRNFQIEMIDFLKDPKFIYVQNSYKLGYQYNLNSEEFEVQDQRWKKSIKKIEELMTFFHGKEGKITTAFKNLRKSRQDLKLELSRCYQEIQALSQNEEVLQDLRQQIATAQKTKNLNANFQIKKTVMETRYNETSYYNTVCRACNNLCHERCGLAYSPGGGSIFQGCACMGSGGKCSRSQCEHSWDCHFHDNKAPIQEPVEELTEDPAMKQVFQTTCKTLQDLENKRQTVENQLTKNQNKQSECLKEIYNLCQELQSVCSRYNLVQELLPEIEIMKSHRARATTVAEADKWTKCIKDIETVIKNYQK